jgi:pyruvate, orthophosphate dikinase
MTESINTLALLQLARVKGLLSAEAASTALGVDLETIRPAFEQFRAQGWLDSTARGWRLTPAGRHVTSTLVVQERATLNAAELKALYGEFCTANAELKATMTAWQLRADGTTNDHGDKAYDQAVTARLSALHANADSTIERIAQAAPRLAHYRRRLANALDKICQGEAAYVARPIIDSYHTVWFELHEDLIAINGLTRAAEAQAGRAQ